MQSSRGSKRDKGIRDEIAKRYQAEQQMLLEKEEKYFRNPFAMSREVNEKIARLQSILQEKNME